MFYIPPKIIGQKPPVEDSDDDEESAQKKKKKKKKPPTPPPPKPPAKKPPPPQKIHILHEGDGESGEEIDGPVVKVGHNEMAQKKRMQSAPNLGENPFALPVGYDPNLSLYGGINPYVNPALLQMPFMGHSHSAAAGTSRPITGMPLNAWSTAMMKSANHDDTSDWDADSATGDEPSRHPFSNGLNRTSNNRPRHPATEEIIVEGGNITITNNKSKTQKRADKRTQSHLDIG